jgi:hypothetical protein
VSVKARTILCDVTLAYGQFSDRYQQAMRRGDFERADDAMSVMQEIERCVTVNETSTSWRRTIEDICRREASRR